MGVLLVSSVLYGWFSHATNDLLSDLVQPSYESQTTFNVGRNPKSVFYEILGWSFEVNVKVEKRVKVDENGNLLCHDGPCPSECEAETEDNKEYCEDIWQHEWVDFEAGQQAPMIVKVTKLLLILTVALSVTMILYNGMMYIIQTWQWKEWKSLIKNVALIVVGILIAFFSVVIIRLIQSIPTSLEEELGSPGYDVDNEVLE